MRLTIFVFCVLLCCSMASGTGKVVPKDGKLAGRVADTIEAAPTSLCVGSILRQIAPGSWGRSSSCTGFVSSLLAWFFRRPGILHVVRRFGNVGIGNFLDFHLSF